MDTVDSLVIVINEKGYYAVVEDENGFITHSVALIPAYYSDIFYYIDTISSYLKDPIFHIIPLKNFNLHMKEKFFEKFLCVHYDARLDDFYFHS